MNLTNYIKNKPQNSYALFASERAVSLLPKEQVSHFALAVITTTCYASTEIQRLAGLYLLGSSARAEQNLANLDALLKQVFSI